MRVGLASRRALLPAMAAVTRRQQRAEDIQIVRPRPWGEPRPTVLKPQHNGMSVDAAVLELFFDHRRRKPERTMRPSHQERYNGRNRAGVVQWQNVSFPS